MTLSLIKVFLAYDVSINKCLTHANVSFSGSLGRKLTLDCIFHNVSSKTRPVLSRSIMSILSHAADSSAVLGVYTKKSDQPCDYKSQA